MTKEVNEKVNGNNVIKSKHGSQRAINKKYSFKRK